MISAKWVQGEKLEPVFKIREEVFVNELSLAKEMIKDDFDELNQSVVLSEFRVPVATGRLVVSDGKFFIDRLCVLKENRGKRHSDLIIRMIVRKAYDMGAKKTYATIDPKLKKIFEHIGFVEDAETEGKLIMAKEGDVGGHCC